MIVVALVALWLPGYAVVRALRAPFAAAAAFPVSALMLAEAVIALAIADLPIRFVTVLAPLTLVTIASLVVVIRRRRSPEPSQDELPESDDGAAATRWLFVVVGALIVFLLAGLALRSTLYPLSGFDTVFRWEALSRLMLEEESLRFYPPISSADFARYTYPDGMPPLVATIYWWLYAGWGATFPALTSVAVWSPGVSCFALVFYAARTLYGTAGGLLGRRALAGSTLFVYGRCHRTRDGLHRHFLRGAVSLYAGGHPSSASRLRHSGGPFCRNRSAVARIRPGLGVVWLSRPRRRALNAPVRAALYRRGRAMRRPLVCPQLGTDRESALSLGSGRARPAGERRAIDAQ